MRPLHRLPGVPVALLLAILPLVPLLGQAPSAEAKLVGADGHSASGTVHIFGTGENRRLHFTPDFSVEKGPDVYVTLTNGPEPVEGASVVIARLTKFSGEQTIELPGTADLSKYSHLVLWCRKYSVAMAVGRLTN